MRIFYHLYFCFTLLLLIGCSKDNAEVIPEDYPLERVVLTKVEVVEGSIYLHWNPIKHFNFNWATLFVHGSSGVREITLSNETLKSQVFNDNFSAGSVIDYKIELKTEEESTLSNVLTLNTEPITISESYVGFNKLKVNYSKHPLYNNFDHYNYEFGYYKHPEPLSPLGGDFVIEYPIVFGSRFSANTYSHLFRTIHQSGNIVISGQIIKRFPVGVKFGKDFYYDFVFDFTNNRYIALGYDHTERNSELYLYAFNANDLSLELSKSLTSLEGVNHHWELTFDKHTGKLIIDFPNESLVIDGSDFSISKTCNCHDYITDADNTSSYITVYRNNVLVCREGGTTHFFNAETKQEIASLASSGGAFRISDDAKYFFLNNNFYELTLNNAQLLMSSGLDEDIRKMVLVFNPVKKTSIVLSSNHSPYRYNFDTKTKEIVNELVNAEYIDYNEMKNEYIYGEYHQFFGNYSDASFVTLWQVDTNKKRKIEVNDDHYSGIYKYVNNKIFYSFGHCLDENWLNY